MGDSRGAEQLSSDPPGWTRDAATAAAAYDELRHRLGERLVEAERTSDHGHAHWDAYRLAKKDPSLHRLLLDALRGEPDQLMALDPVITFVEGDDPTLARLALDVLASDGVSRHVRAQATQRARRLRKELAAEGRHDAEPTARRGTT